jgi:chromate transport protein ChrA
MWVFLLLVALKLSSCIPAVLVAGLIERTGDVTTVDAFEGASHWAELLVAAFLTLGYNAVVRAPPSRASSLASVGLMFTAFALLVLFPWQPFPVLLILFTAAWVRVCRHLAACL